MKETYRKTYLLLSISWLNWLMLNQLMKSMFSGVFELFTKEIIKMPKCPFSYKKNDSTPNPPGGVGGIPKILVLRPYSSKFLVLEPYAFNSGTFLD